MSNNNFASDATSIKDAFKQHDRNKSGAIEVDEFKNFCQEIGLTHADGDIVSMFVAADIDRDAALNLREFSAIYLKLTSPTLLNVLQQQHPDQLASLKECFTRWATFGDRNKAPPYRLGNAHWIKLAKDTNLVHRKALSSVDADLIFAKVKSKGNQRITFAQFLDALHLVSIKLGKDGGILEIIEQVIQSKGPSINGTVINLPLKHVYAPSAHKLKNILSSKLTETEKLESSQDFSIPAKY